MMRGGEMGRICEICGKVPRRGYHYKRRGLAKAKGGVGQKVTGKTKRTFKPNLQYVRALVNGGIKRMRVCVTCIKSGRVKKALRTKRTVPAEKTA